MSLSEQPIVVIGSGPGGAAAALALSQRGFPVTVLESGASQPRAFRVQLAGVAVYKRSEWCRSPLEYTTAPGVPAAWHHELALGGLSNQWTGASPRFHPDDFTDGARVGPEFDWPVRYGGLAPYYAWAERLLQIQGTSVDVPCLPAGLRKYERKVPRDWASLDAVLRSQGQGLVPIPLATGARWGVSRSAAPFNSRDVVARLARNGRRVNVVRGAHATRIVCNGSSTASAVEFIDALTGQPGRVRCSGVVIAAGAPATCKLLLHSTDGVGGAAGLGNDNGLVGAYAHDHTKDWTVISLDRPMARLAHPLYMTRRAHSASEPMSGVSYTFSARTCPRDRKFVHLPGKSSTFGFNSFGMWTPSRANRIKLSRCKQDSFGQQQLEIDVRFPADAMNILDESRQHMLNSLDDAGLSPRVITTVNDCVPGDSVHWAGTARMHDSPEFGVCDGDGRIHGVDNVVIGDASVFPTPVEKNPTLTLMALSGRAAVRLARRLADKP